MMHGASFENYYKDLCMQVTRGGYPHGDQYAPDRLSPPLRNTPWWIKNLKKYRDVVRWGKRVAFMRRLTCALRLRVAADACC